MSNCPICGGPMVGSELRWMPKARLLVWHEEVEHFSVQEAIMFEILWRARDTGEFVMSSAIIDAFYTRSDGGPDSGLRAPAQAVLRIRRKLVRFPLAVESHYGGGDRLVAAD